MPKSDIEERLVSVRNGDFVNLCVVLCVPRELANEWIVDKFLGLFFIYDSSELA